MNKRVKGLWIKALRSGKFKQCKAKLRKKVNGEQCHCCLGVLEEIHAAETGTRFSGGRGGNNNLLSDTAREWAGLDDADPVLLPKIPMTAAELNDDGRSFQYIADKIEKYI